MTEPTNVPFPPLAKDKLREIINAYQSEAATALQRLPLPTFEDFATEQTRIFGERVRRFDLPERYSRFLSLVKEQLLLVDLILFFAQSHGLRALSGLDRVIEDIKTSHAYNIVAGRWDAVHPHDVPGSYPGDKHSPAEIEEEKAKLMREAQAEALQWFLRLFSSAQDDHDLDEVGQPQ